MNSAHGPTSKSLTVQLNKPMYNKLNRWSVALLSLAAGIALSGCVAAIGNDTGRRPAGGATVGQELIDLQKAKDSGAINDAEFEAQRARILGHK